MADRAGRAPDHPHDRRRRRVRSTWRSATGRCGPPTTSTAASPASIRRPTGSRPRYASARPQALAAGEGSAWVSVAEGGTREASCRRSTCGEVAAGRPRAGRPDRLRPAAAGRRGAPTRARWPTRSASCSATTASAPASSRSATSRATTPPHRRALRAAQVRRQRERVRAGAIARGASSARTTRRCAQVEIPILNRAPGGPAGDRQPVEHATRTSPAAAGSLCPRRMVAGASRTSTTPPASGTSCA